MLLVAEFNVATAYTFVDSPQKKVSELRKMIYSSLQKLGLNQA